MAKTIKKRAEIKTEYGMYDVLLENEPDMGGYMVTAPKLPDVVTWGKTTTEAKRMAKEAIECSIEGEIILAAEKQGRVAILDRRHTRA